MGAEEPLRSGLVNVPGALTWNDLGTTDVAAAKTFYGELFGWEMEDPDPAVPYTMIENAGTENGSIHLESDDTPPSWLAYFASKRSMRASPRSAIRAGASSSRRCRFPQAESRS